MEPIIIGYDGSDGAKRAIEFAGRNFGARDAIVVTAFEDWPPTMRGDAVAVGDAVTSRGDGRRGRFTARAAGLVAEARTVFAAEKAWQAIINTADEVDAALIVVGSHGVSGLRPPAKRMGPPLAAPSIHAGGRDATLASRQRELRRLDDRLPDRDQRPDE